MIAPTGQYDGTKLVNWGINRWAFKPDFGYSQRWGRTMLDAYAGAWFYTKNPASYSVPVPKPQTEAPVGSFEGHLSYDVKPRLWFSLDGNLWFGGVTSLSGIQNLKTRQTGSRVGVTGSYRVSKHQSLKLVIAMASTCCLAGTIKTSQWRGSIPGSASKSGESSNRQPKPLTSYSSRPSPP